ncbi:hypothetical protein EKO04_009761 [Ascochyta lentis]|uniref:Integral membrane protein n=1 Tax=Ascochyta lentis TaxID=205686 RepID=A0A8H7IZP3_9PLEO|nr:hypothetical protein EKO04_009761 [Ascochyta lentis]
MRSLMIFIVLVAFLHTASATLFSPPTFLDFVNLPECVKACKVITDTSDSCPSPKGLPSNDTAYADCFCQSDTLRGLYDDGEPCHASCSHDEDLVISMVYDIFCSVSYNSTAPSKTPLPTPAPTPTSLSSSPHDALTTHRSSTSEAQPGNTPTTGVEEPQTEHTPPQSWIQRNWKHVLPGVLVLVFVLALALYVLALHLRRRRLERPLSDAERLAEMERHLQERLEEEFGPIARGQIVPLKTLNPKSIRGLLSRLPLSRLPRSKTPIRDPVINRRQRQRDPDSSTLDPLNRHSPSAAHGTWTPQRPASARTIASSIGQRSVSSPLVPISRDMLRNISYAESLRHYAEEQAEMERDLDIIRSISSGNLRRSDGFYDGQ